MKRQGKARDMRTLDDQGPSDHVPDMRTLDDPEPAAIERTAAAPPPERKPGLRAWIRRAFDRMMRR